MSSTRMQPMLHISAGYVHPRPRMTSGALQLTSILNVSYGELLQYTLIFTLILDDSVSLCVPGSCRTVAWTIHHGTPHRDCNKITLL